MPRRRVPIAQRGPGASYRPDDVAPSFRAAHQPGIATPVLDHLAFAALDLAADEPAALRALLAAWTEEGERRMRAVHRPAGAAGPAGALTLTIGLGPRVFAPASPLAARRPVALAELPPFADDAIAPGNRGGDLCVQACAATPGAADEALAALVALAAPAARVRWEQRASMRRAPGDQPGGRPRNLLGFKDGTNTLRRGRDLDRLVWASNGDRTWMAGGTYLVVRRVRILLDAWARLTPAEQERVIGRHRDTGAPLGRRHEFDPPLPGRVPPDAHAALAAPEANGGVALLRRGYSYDDGDGDAGIVLLLCQRDPRRQFVPLQRRLSAGDALRPFTRTVGSAVFAIPPGAPAGEALAAALFAP